MGRHCQDVSRAVLSLLPVPSQGPSRFGSSTALWTAPFGTRSFLVLDKAPVCQRSTVPGDEVRMSKLLPRSARPQMVRDRTRQQFPHRATLEEEVSTR